MKSGRSKLVERRALENIMHAQNSHQENRQFLVQAPRTRDCAGNLGAQNLSTALINKQSDQEN